MLYDRCSPAFVASLRIDPGLSTLAHKPEREHQLLLNIARQPAATLALACTPRGEIVGELTIAPADSWWSGLHNLYEMGLDVSASWRRMGIAQRLLQFAFAGLPVEKMILLAIGLSWHWDTEGTGVDARRYRSLMAQKLARYGFIEYFTSEPNILMDPANILLARIGRHVDQETISAFFNRLLGDYTSL
ncbi:MAG: GNAT family N-acetyltransferase [Ktedonobacteraceae bacterium]|nr:GNAT family N-acetyltransferase [Ktedonobacteraceae bacterium]